MIDLETIDYLNGKVRLQTFQPAAIDTFFEVDKSHEGRPITRIFVRGGVSWDAYVTRADLAQQIRAFMAEGTERDETAPGLFQIEFGGR
jgi:hypothetical protein